MKKNVNIVIMKSREKSEQEFWYLNLKFVLNVL